MLKLSENDKILIVRLSALGDCIHTIPLLVAIKKEYPNLFIGWAVGEKSKAVVEHNPLLDRVHIIPKNNSKKYANVMSEIRKEKYTIAIDSQELLKSALVSFSSNAKYRLAHNKSREFSHFFANKKLPEINIFDTSRHVIERNMDFARFLGIEKPEIDFVLPPTSKEDKRYINELLANINTNKKVIILAPSTTWITKFWTKENWAELINNLDENIILSGSPADEDYINQILALTSKKDNIINLVGKTNILQLKELFCNADIVVCPDSGSAHLAAATKKPTVITLCGATSPVRNGAFGEKNINLTASLNCQYCYKKICKFKEGIPECMQQIKLSNVLEKIKSVI